jgi:cbb3-type cytochrome oxidase subunit 3
MSLSPKQMKMVAVAMVLLWLVGLTAAILARRRRQRTGAQHANLPLITYLTGTGFIFLVAGVVYYERRGKRSEAAAAPLPPSEDSPPEDSEGV